MRLVLKLVFANLWQHPARLVLSSLAVVAAACVVVWVVSGYDALLGQFNSFADEYLGRYQLIVVSDDPDHPPRPGAPSGPPIDPKLVELLGKDPAVVALDPIFQTRLKRAEPTKALDRPKGPGAANAPPAKSGADEAAGPRDRAKVNAPRRQGPPDAGPARTRSRGAGNRSGGPGRGGGRGRGPGRGGPARRSLFRPVPTLVGTNARQGPHEMVEGRWLDPARPKRAEGVLTCRIAEQLDVALGDELIIESEQGKSRLRIVGLIEQVSIQGGGPRGPSFMRGPASSALYVPIALAEKITGKPAEIDCVNVALAETADVGAFRKRWNKRIKQEGFLAAVFDPTDVKTDLAEGWSASRVRNQAYSATGISLLAALFIILTTLSMGVHERTRQFAVLRAVALTRRQVGAMIAVESLILAVIGWAGGLAAGWGLLWIMAQAQPDLFRGGVSLGTYAVALSGVCAIGGALAAAILPAWKATRVSPLEAMVPRHTARPARLSWIAVAIGLAMIVVNPLLVFVVPMADEARYGIYAALGCSSMAIGFLLLAPAVILLAERLVGPVVSLLLGLDRRLLGMHLSSNLWRTLGTTVALAIGLGLFVAMQTWGRSMLQPFVPGDWSPDALVCFTAGGLPDEEIATVARIDGIAPGRCMPLAVEQAKLANDITKSQERITVARQDNVIMIGADPRLALGGEEPMLNLDFVEGTREQALARLEQGRGCIVPDHFARATGLGVGDRFELLPPEHPDKPVEYTIAGVVSLPGWHWMTKFSGMRRRSGRSAAMIFANREDVARDFDLGKVNFIWFDVAPGADLDKVGEGLAVVARRYPGPEQPVNAQGRWAFAARMFGPEVRITTADDARGRIYSRSNSMIWAMCQLPLVTLLVTSLGVVNAVGASVRARRWELGVLRAVGLTRFALVRMILAEAILIGLVACLLSLGFGIMAGWCGMGISQYVSFFGGLAPSLVVPWATLSIGLAATLLLCLAAAAWPAISTGRAEPLGLLQAGRAAI